MSNSLSDAIQEIMNSSKEEGMNAGLVVLKKEIGEYITSFDEDHPETKVKIETLHEVLRKINKLQEESTKTKLEKYENV